jgi:hypothetical protein
MDGSSLAPFFSPLLFFNLSYCIQLVVAIKRKLSGVVQAPALAKENKSAKMRSMCQVKGHTLQIGVIDAHAPVVYPALCMVTEFSPVTVGFALMISSAVASDIVYMCMHV